MIATQQNDNIVLESNTNQRLEVWHANNSFHNPNLKFANFVDPKLDPIRAQRWIELICNEDFSLEECMRTSLNSVI